MYYYPAPWTNVDVRNLTSSEINDVVQKIPSLSNVRITVSTKQEIIRLDKITRLLNRKVQINELSVFINNDFDECFLYYMFVTLSREKLQVLVFFFVLEFLTLW